jgi:hypothetical protein
VHCHSPNDRVAAVFGFGQSGVSPTVCEAEIKASRMLLKSKLCTILLRSSLSRI